MSTSNGHASNGVSPTRPSLSVVFRATLIDCGADGARGSTNHSATRATLRLRRDQLCAVRQDTGRIVRVVPYSEKAVEELQQHYTMPPRGITQLKETQFIIPGYIDTHCHAPQFQFAGTGTDRDLMVWLQTYTFPAEQRMADLPFAQSVYARLVRAGLSAGTTCAFYYASIHLDATKALVDTCVKMGQRAFVGKVNMDQHSPPGYIESTEDSLRDTEAFIQYVKSLRSPLVQAVITPRFIPTCSEKLLSGLAELARKHDLWIQSHASESSDQVAFVKSILPELGAATDKTLPPPGCKAGDATDQVVRAGLRAGRCTGIFDHFGLLTDKCMMAHGTFLEEDEWRVFRARGVSIAHCPLSNLFCSDRYLKLKPLIARGNKVGLGSDVAGGYALSIHQNIRQAVLTSKFYTAAIAQHPEMEIVHDQQPAGSLPMRGHRNNNEQSVKSNGHDATADAVTVVDDKASSDDNTTNSSTLSFKDAFWLATAGGAEAINMSDSLGLLDEGYLFDAQLIDLLPEESHPHPATLSNTIHLFPSDSLEDLFQKFMNLGDDRHVAEVYVNGQVVKTRAAAIQEEICAEAAVMAAAVDRSSSASPEDAAAIMPANNEVVTEADKKKASNLEQNGVTVAAASQ